MFERTKTFVSKTFSRIRSGIARRMGWLGVGLVGAMPLGVIVGILRGGPEAGGALVAGLGFASLLCFGIWTLFRTTFTERTGTIRLHTSADDATLAGDALRFEVEGETPLAVPIAQIASGWVMPSSRPKTPLVVELELKDGDRIRIDVADLDEGFELLAVAGVSAKDRKVKVRRRMHGQFTLAFLVSLASSVVPAALAAFTGGVTESVFAALIYLVGFALLMRGSLWLFSPGDITVGEDGVSFGKLSKRLVPIRDIRQARLVGETLFLDLHGGGSEILKLGPIGPWLSQMLCTRINRALELAEAGEEVVPLADLDRDGRALDEWQAALRRVLGGVDDGYRAPHIPRMRIVETLEDPNASPERRLGAAIALTEAGDGDARKIMLRVANATADDELADALRETAEGILAEATVDRLRHVK